MSDRWPMAGPADTLWLIVLLGVLLAVAIGLLVLAARRGQGHANDSTERQRPEAVLCDRYARGEIGLPAYREALVNMLKDRYVRDEISLDEYETRLSKLLGDAFAPGAGGAGLGTARQPLPGQSSERMAAPGAETKTAGR
jgi:uncharacterized membrane protein